MAPVNALSGTSAGVTVARVGRTVSPSHWGRGRGRRDSSMPPGSNPPPHDLYLMRSRSSLFRARSTVRRPISARRAMSSSDVSGRPVGLRVAVEDEPDGQLGASVWPSRSSTKAFRISKRSRPPLRRPPGGRSPSRWCSSLASRRHRAGAWPDPTERARAAWSLPPFGSLRWARRARPA